MIICNVDRWRTHNKDTMYFAGNNRVYFVGNKSYLYNLVPLYVPTHNGKYLFLFDWIEF